jgi:hypothetical protein
MISGFHCHMNESFSFLGCYTVLESSWVNNRRRMAFFLDHSTCEDVISMSFQNIGTQLISDAA